MKPSRKGTKRSRDKFIIIQMQSSLRSQSREIFSLSIHKTPHTGTKGICILALCGQTTLETKVYSHQIYQLKNLRLINADNLFIIIL